MKLRLTDLARLSLLPTVLLSTSLSIGLVLSLAAAASPKPAPRPGPGAVLSAQLNLMRVLDAGDALAIADCLPRSDGPTAERVWLEVVDAEGRPRTARGHAAASQLLAECARELATLGARTRLTDSDSDCPSRVGWAVTGLERRFEVAGTASDPSPNAAERDAITPAQRLRSTVLMVYEEEGWRLLHWHLSLAASAGKDR